MNLAIIGSRDFNNYDLLKQTILSLININDVNSIVSGGANGADKLAEKFAEEFGLQKIIFKPDWNKFGKSAGIIRNSDIVKNSDMVIAFWDGNSKGTKKSIDISKKLGKKLKVVTYK